MPDRLDAEPLAEPFVCETLTSKALYFSFADTQSRMNLQRPELLELEYTRLMMGFLLFVPRPQRIAMIGLGGGSLAKFCHRHLPRASLDVVEINPQVIALRDEFRVPPDDPRFRVIEDDGAHFVGWTPRRFDVLLVDGFDRDGLPAALSSQRFYDDCLDVLDSGGLMVANLHRGQVQHAAVVERIRRSFGGCVLAVEDGEGGNSVVFACKGERLQRRLPVPLPRPRGLAKAAWAELQPACERIAAALQESRT